MIHNNSDRLKLQTTPKVNCNWYLNTLVHEKKIRKNLLLNISVKISEYFDYVKKYRG